MSKGSAPRPFDVDHKVFENNWDAIFGKKNETKNVEDEHDNVVQTSAVNKAVPDDSDRS